MSSAMDNKLINKYRRSFIYQMLITLIVLVGGGYAVAELWLGYTVALPLSVSATVFFILELADILIWSCVASNSPDSLPTFFMGVSGFRMLICLMVFFIFYFVASRQQMLLFLCIFAVFYVAMLVHHTLFFSHGKGK